MAIRAEDVTKWKIQCKILSQKLEETNARIKQLEEEAIIEIIDVHAEDRAVALLLSQIESISFHKRCDREDCDTCRLYSVEIRTKAGDQIRVNDEEGRRITMLWRE